MSALVNESEPIAAKVTVAAENFSVTLEDGRTLTVPFTWYPRLLHASISERQHWQIVGNGYAIAWPFLDEHIGVEGLLEGRRSGESEESFDRWLKNRGSLGTALGLMSYMFWVLSWEFTVALFIGRQLFGPAWFDNLRGGCSSCQSVLIGIPFALGPPTRTQIL